MSYVGISEEALVYEDIVTIDGTNNTVKAVVNFGSIYNVSMNNNNNDDALIRYRQFKQRQFDKLLGHKRNNDNDYPEGMMGMAYTSLNTLGTTTLFDQLVLDKAVDNVFSICLNQEGGMMMLGGIGPWNSEPIVYTPVTQEYFYNVYMYDMQVNGHSIELNNKVYNNKYCIVDTGTPLPTVHPIVLETLRDIFINNCSNANLTGICRGITSENATLFDNVCFNMSQEDIDAFPTIQYVLRSSNRHKNTVIEYPPQFYLQKQYFCQTEGTYGLGFATEEDFTVLGAELLQRYNTIYDRTNKRIGFAKMNTCK